MWGQLGSVYVHVHSVRTDCLHYQLEVSVRFPEPLALGLDVQPTGVLDKVAVFFGGQDIQTGQPAFDGAFRVKAADTAGAVQLLDPGRAARILQLQANAGPTLINDEGIAVRLPSVPHDPSAIPRVVQHMSALAEDLGADTRLTPLRAYR
jgi:hypothetical protein